MSETNSKYNVVIHGNAYGLVVGDNSRVSQRFGGGDGVNTPPFIVPALPPQGIIGRDETLTQIYDLLRLDSTAAEVPPAALRGLGGIGKTTLAIALGRLSLVQEHFPDGVLWASVGPTPTIRLLLDGWGRALGVDLLPERDEQACKERLQAILYRRRVLLLVDDVWEVVHGQHFTVAGPACRTLFTTRESPVAHALATRERTLPVDVLKPEDALALLQRLAPDAVVADRENALRLCERVEFLPLALTLAGRLLADEADIPTRMQRLVGDLIERRESRLHLMQAEGRLGITGEEPVSLQAILALSVDRLDRVDQERFAMASIFGGDPLTWEIKAAAFVWECSVEDAEASVARFIQRGLVERRGERYWMHALLADYAAEMMERFGL